MKMLDYLNKLTKARIQNFKSHKIIFIASALCLSHLANSQIYKAELVANGLTCSMCSNATLKQLETIAFLDSINIDIEYTKFILYFKPATPYDLNTIRAKVEDAGFAVGSLILFMKLDNLSIDNDFQYTQGNISYHFIDGKKQILNDINKLKIIDKGFISEKEFKKYVKYTEKYPCYEAGNVNIKKNHYHLKVIEK